MPASLKGTHSFLALILPPRVNKTKKNRCLDFNCALTRQKKFLKVYVYGSKIFSLFLKKITEVNNINDI
ncbi:unnamed protein product [Meloidogyne enterolobii]|uniref:Uncharacterized protein n=2 Tax=Meloidogyne enterolobii TaxID=390850 RepID=A0A6V7XFU1_MELEN|nr:unnamed protein product [Meloidogyne enterolobii]